MENREKIIHIVLREDLPNIDEPENLKELVVAHMEVGEDEDRRAQKFSPAFFRFRNFDFIRMNTVQNRPCVVLQVIVIGSPIAICYQ